MSLPLWSAPAWIGSVPNVSFADEIQLLESFAKQATRTGCRVVPNGELDFETTEYADLVIERTADKQRLMFGLSRKGPNDPSRIDVLTRPRTGHARLQKRDNQWRLVLGSHFIHPKTVAELGLAGLLGALLDDRM
jgi:hypothetical protein